MIRDRDKGAQRHLVDVDDPAGLALCGRPGPWSPFDADAHLKAGRCADCATSHQMTTNHVGGRTWAGG